MMVFDENIGLDNIMNLGLDKIKELDKSEMYSYLSSQAIQTLESYNKNKMEVVESNDIINIIAAGIGGSGMPLVALKFLFEDELLVPFVVSQAYNLPRFANSRTLLIAISDSGKTEDIINQYHQAKQKGAKLIAIGQGNKLIEIAKEDNNLRYIYKTKVPARASFAYMFGSSLAFLENFNLIRENNKVGILESIEVINELTKNLGIEVPLEYNPAKKIALLLKGKIPLVIVEAPFNSLGSRFAKMLNENAGLLAFYNYFPEFRHNEIMALAPTDKIKLQFVEADSASCVQAYDYKSKIFPIFLLDNEENSRMKRELGEIQKTIEINKTESTETIEVHSNHLIIRAKGNTKIARFFYLQYIMDMISYYMGIMLGCDPSETPVLLELKSRLQLYQS